MVFQGLRDYRQEAWNYHEIGVLYRSSVQNKQAYEYYHKALEIFEKLNDSDGIEACCSELAIIYSDWGWIEKSLEMNKKNGSDL